MMRWFRLLPLAALGVLMQLGSVAHAQRCTVPLVGFGPIDPTDGFPQYYVDSNNLGLAQCLDFVCDPALPVPNPNQPVSFPNNFPDEFFYQRAIANMPGPNGEWYVIEVNAVPGWRALAPVTGVDVADEIVRHLEETMRHHA